MSVDGAAKDRIDTGPSAGPHMVRSCEIPEPSKNHYGKDPLGFLAGVLKGTPKFTSFPCF